MKDKEGRNQRRKEKERRGRSGIYKIAFWNVAGLETRIEIFGKVWRNEM